MKFGLFGKDGAPDLPLVDSEGLASMSIGAA